MNEWYNEILWKRIGENSATLSVLCPDCGLLVEKLIKMPIVISQNYTVIDGDQIKRDLLAEHKHKKECKKN